MRLDATASAAAAVARFDEADECGGGDLDTTRRWALVDSKRRLIIDFLVAEAIAMRRRAIEMCSRAIAMRRRASRLLVDCAPIETAAEPSAAAATDVRRRSRRLQPAFSLGGCCDARRLASNELRT